MRCPLCGSAIDDEYHCEIADDIGKIVSDDISIPSCPHCGAALEGSSDPTVDVTEVEIDYFDTTDYDENEPVDLEDYDPCDGPEHICPYDAHYNADCAFYCGVGGR